MSQCPVEKKYLELRYLDKGELHHVSWWNQFSTAQEKDKKESIKKQS